MTDNAMVVLDPMALKTTLEKKTDYDLEDVRIGGNSHYGSLVQV